MPEGTEHWLFNDAPFQFDVPLSDLCQNSPQPEEEVKKRDHSQNESQSQSSGEETTKSKKNKQSGRACLCCAKAHAACDRVRPVCGRCKKRGYTQCVVPTEKKRRRLPHGVARYTKTSVELEPKEKAPVTSFNGPIRSASPSELFSFMAVSTDQAFHSGSSPVVRHSPSKGVRFAPYQVSREESPVEVDFLNDEEVELYSAMSESRSPPSSRSLSPDAVVSSPTTSSNLDVVMTSPSPSSPLEYSTIEELFDAKYHGTFTDSFSDNVWNSDTFQLTQPFPNMDQASQLLGVSPSHVNSFPYPLFA